VTEDIDLRNRNDEGYFFDDFLGQAADAGSRAREAIEAGDLNAAWGHYQRMSHLYLQHAQKERFTRQQTLELVGSTHGAMASLLRQEGRHPDALVHILYCIACSGTASEKDLKRYRPFVNRCKFQEFGLEEVAEKLQRWKENPDLASIRDTVSEWKARGRRE
jgi:hypothetical protein